MEKHHEDFGQTLGYWGIGSAVSRDSIARPSSVRDGLGLYADSRSGVLRRIKYVDFRNQLYATDLLSKRTSC